MGSSLWPLGVSATEASRIQPPSHCQALPQRTEAPTQGGGPWKIPFCSVTRLGGDGTPLWRRQGNRQHLVHRVNEHKVQSLA